MKTMPSILQCGLRKLTASDRRETAMAGYMLIEALVYIGVLLALLGVAYSALYRCIDNSVALRHSSDDIQAALHAGEIWRADVRRATKQPSSSQSASELVLITDRGPITYRFETNGILRRVGTSQWTCALRNVKWSSMQTDPWKSVSTCRWEFELLPYHRNHSNPNRVHPIFSFAAVPNRDGL
jgi:hypothetical protein